MRHAFGIILSFILGLWLVACGSTVPPPNVEETVAAAVAETVAALPTQPAAQVAEVTPLPTYTPFPTYTPYPTVEQVAAEIEEEPTSEPTPEAPSPTSPPPPPPPTATLVPNQPSDTVVRPMDGATMVFVPAGEFLLGASDNDLAIVGAGGPPKLAGGDEQPQHPVNLDAFWIDQTEVTNAQYSNFVNLTGYQTTAELEGYGTSSGEQVEGATFYHPRGVTTGIDDKQDHPVVQISWQDAKTYCEWVGARLPTEAEWEKAAKGSANDRIFPWGNGFQLPEFDISTVTNSCGGSCPYESRDPNIDDGFAYTAPVGSFPAGASPYGALDMAGNVWEWVDSSYLGYPGNTYEQAQDFNEHFKVVRGGSWDNAAQHLRVTFRQNNEPRLRSDGTGFRCAVSTVDFEPTAQEVAPEPETVPIEETTEPEAEQPDTESSDVEPSPEQSDEAADEPAPESTPEPDTGG